MNDPLITYRVRDASRATGIGVTMLYELIGKGELVAYRFGNRTLITRESLLRYIAGLPRVPRSAGADDKADTSSLAAA